jgi:hypothetical protein
MPAMSTDEYPLNAFLDALVERGVTLDSPEAKAAFEAECLKRYPTSFGPLTLPPPRLPPSTATEARALLDELFADPPDPEGYRRRVEAMEALPEDHHRRMAWEIYKAYRAEHRFWDSELAAAVQSWVDLLPEDDPYRVNWNRARAARTEIP